MTVRPEILIVTPELIVNRRKCGVPFAALRIIVSRFTPGPFMLTWWFMLGSAPFKLIVFGVFRLKLILIVPPQDESAFAS